MMMEDKDPMEQAKMHYEALMASLSELGMSLEEFKKQVEAGPQDEESESENSSEYESEDSENESESEAKPALDKTKIALIVARMKNKSKG